MGAMKYLLDTHTLLWATRDIEKLSGTALAVIEDTDSMLFVSSVSGYEIMFKHYMGKLTGYSYVADNFFEILGTLDVIELPVNMRHAHFAGTIDWTHRDPFDRLLVAQAHVENMIMITDDTAIKSLPWVNTLW